MTPSTPFDVVQIPVWTDNYAYLLCPRDGTAAVVDSPEAEPILEVLSQGGLQLTHIFNTHHHFDHIGANQELIAAFPDVVVCGGRYDAEHQRIPGQTRILEDGETFEWGGDRCTVREVPAHTLGHIAYCWDSNRAFVGDTLFFGGCGRLFEGTAAMMDRALYEVLGRLDNSTLLYCAHEYTEANLRFARTVDPHNAELLALSEEVASLRARGKPTVPSRLEQEWAINPFLRCDSPTIRQALNCDTSSPRHEVLGALRTLKDGFRG
ncbi:MAG TPA: hydroxyacylglutathione hydrolase [Deltaproteobacteria bacterium]|nr:hydroxyacylglutathione hydrolase [Deltaproteobacteria bacterium]HCP47716.1 hydroxyacylglutathione hydrolase [Deltaproteobacteria bacterium]